MSIAFVLKGYPRLSETFIAQEILGMEQRGKKISIFSLRHPTDRTRHPVHKEISAPVTYLPEYLLQEVWRVFSCWRETRKLPGYKNAFKVFLKDLRRDRSANRIRRFGQACVLARSLPEDCQQIHFHFLHTPASVARYTALMTGLPLSGSAHAKDIWTSPDWEIREKLDDLNWLVTCTKHGARYLQAIAREPEKIILAYHGLDLHRFPEIKREKSTADGTKNQPAVEILSVGRAVAKKGYDDVMTALSALPENLNWHFTHIGNGELINKIKDHAKKLGIIDKITFLGTQPQTEILSRLRQSDLFLLASKIAGNGDRDGLPNVLMEAQSQNVCVIATTTAAIPELIDHNETGIMVEPGNPAALSAALERLICDPGKRQSLAQAGARKIRQNFDAKSLLDELSQQFDAGKPGKKAA